MNPRTIAFVATYTAVAVASVYLARLLPGLPVAGVHVPISFMPFLAAFAGVFLGARNGALAMGLYLLLGLLGFPSLPGVPGDSPTSSPPRSATFSATSSPPLRPVGSTKRLGKRETGLAEEVPAGPRGIAPPPSPTFSPWRQPSYPSTVRALSTCGGS